MAKIRAMIGSGGGGEALVETLLWTNPSPSSGSSGATITLSGSINDFDYIKLVYNYSKSDFRSYSVMVPVDEFETQSGNNTSRSLYCGLQLSSGLFLRAFNYVSNTSIEFTNAMRLNGNANNDATAIPYKIYGVKKSSIGSFNVKVIEPTVVVGQNTIETGVTIRQIMYVWQKANGSDDKYINGQWSDIRPNETWISFNTSSTANGKRTVPNSQTTNIQSVSGTSFTFGVGQADYNLFNGSPLRFYIYY